MTLRLLLLAALALAPAAKAPAAPAGGLAVLGLRPVEAGPGSATAITRLAEAQRLRAAVEGVAEALGGAPPLRHDDLRGALGRAYLVTLFDCLDDEPCLLAAAAPLRARGVDAALVGEYGRQGDLLTVRLRRLDLRAGRVAAAATFEVPAAQAEALAPWRAGLAPLFDDTGSLALVVNLPGKPSAIDDCLQAVFPAVPYCLDLIEGDSTASRLETDPQFCAAFRPAHARKG